MGININNKNLKILVLGAGSIGMRHINNLIILKSDVYCWRVRNELFGELTKSHQLKELKYFPKSLKKFSGVVIATNPDTHLNFSKICVEQNIPFFLEKPLTNNYENTKKLYDIWSTNKNYVEVGLSLRMHRSILKIKKIIEEMKYGKPIIFNMWVGQNLFDWRENYKINKTYSFSEKKGGGIPNDLIHEVDIVTFLFGKVFSLSSVLKRIGNITLDGNDIGCINFDMCSGVVGHLQMDLVSPVMRRGCSIVFEDSILDFDYVTGIINIKSKKNNKNIINKINKSRNVMFFDHMKHFINNINKKPPIALCSMIEANYSSYVCEVIKMSHIKEKKIILKNIDEKIS